MRPAVLALTVVLAFGTASRTLPGQTPATPAQTGSGAGPGDFQRAPDFDRQLQQQNDTDKTWRRASEGVMQMEKITYRSRAGDLDIPAFVFQPLQPRGPKSRAALVWVHDGIRGHVSEMFIPYVREAVGKGYIVIAPEYRGGIGY